MSYPYNRNYYVRKPRAEKPAHLTDPTLLDRLNSMATSSDSDQWTRNFCTSLAEGFKKYKGLTQRQYDIFVKKEHQSTPEFQAARNEWRASYDDEKRRIAKVCAEYYKANPPYFADLADKVIDDPDFIPSPRQFKAMCENKYAKKVLKSADGEATFKVGQIIELRASAPHAFKLRFPLGKGAILQSGAAPVKSAAKGGKVYNVLPLGSADTVEIEERHIKKAKGIK
jgi:hypothetical protein|tara:strand:- start:775 stop:1452 length:678 start_codon:yes stop_codon:yes gene_type:complete